MQYWYAVLPPLIAIIIAIWKKEIIIALITALWLAETLLHNSNPFIGMMQALERIVNSVFADPDNARIVLFSLLVGALLALLRDSGSVNAFVNKLTARGLVKTPRRAATLPCMVGIAIFIDSMLGIITAGILARRLFDKFKMSRARLAYIIDSTASPASILILLNAWGAFILISIQDYGLTDPVRTLVYSIAFNFYPILAIIAVIYTVISGKVYGPLKRTESQLSENSDDLSIANAGKAKPYYMPLVIALLAGMMIGFMFYTGAGNLYSGSGSRSAFWAIALTVFIFSLILVKDKIYQEKKLVQVCFRGMGELLPLVSILILALALGAACRELGTGIFFSALVGDFLPVFLILPIIFISAATISFTTGTSWGTFAIMIPIGLPLAAGLNMPAPILLAAILGGGVWGDHCSPISDSTLMASIASGCDHLDHVRTQLPYALALGGITIIIYLIIGIILT